MDVRGQRILIFGDSLSHHGPDAGPEIWDVDQGSNRISGQPGDLLASMLREQGASAVRVNARVGRSAHNFFNRENHQALLASDQAFMPSKVFVVLGTNDIGLNLDADANSMRKIRDFYKGLGAEVWGVGPFQYASSTLNQQAEPVVAMMKSVFGASRYIDPRPITAMVGRAGDGVHFGGESARITALGLQKLILETASPKTWLPFAIGLLGAVGGALAYSWWKSGKVAMPFSGGLGDLGERCDPNMSAAAFKRCVARQKRAQLGEDPLAKRQQVSKQIKELIADPDPGAMDVAQDLALEHEIKLSELTKGGTDDRGAIWLDKKKDPFKSDHVSWSIKRLDTPRNDQCEASFDVWIDGERVGGAPKDSQRHIFEEDYKGSDAYCRRAATSQAWAIAKEVKKLRAKGFKPRSFDIWHVLDRDNSKPEELFGTSGLGDSARFTELLMDPDPAALDIAQDMAMAEGLKLSALSMEGTFGTQKNSHGEFRLAPGYRQLVSKWRISRPMENPQSGLPNCEINLEQYVDGKKLDWSDMPHNERFVSGLVALEKQRGTVEQCRRVAAQEAWAIGKEMKYALGESLAEPEVRRVKAMKAVERAVSRPNRHREPAELFGLDATKRRDGSERMNPDWTYVDDNIEDVEAFKKTRSKFRQLINDGDPASLDIAEDLAEESGFKISQLTTLQHDDADRGVVTIYPQDGSAAVYKVWWDVHENANRKGEWEPELLLAWGMDRDVVGAVPYKVQGTNMHGKVPIKFGYFDTAQEAREAAAFNAWQVAKMLRTVPRSASINEAEQLIRDRESAHPDDPRFVNVERTTHKHHLFGQRSALQSPGMAGYRIGYSGVGPDGRTVIRFVTDEIAPDLATAERWRRRFKNSNGWIEDEAGNHVPVKGALKPMKRNVFSAHATPDQLPKWLR